MIELFYPDTVESRYNEPFRGLKMKTLRIKLYKAILYNFNYTIYIRDFAQRLRMIRPIYM